MSPRRLARAGTDRLVLRRNLPPNVRALDEATTVGGPVTHRARRAPLTALEN